jgi:hypothetical protein
MEEFISIMVYLDDIIIFSFSLEQHLKDLTEVFNRIREASLKLKASKCNLFIAQITYLGHIIDEQGIRPDPGKIQAIKTILPTSVKDVRSFFGIM